MASKLVWVDCEMTGLGAPGSVGTDRLLEIAVIVTDSDLSNIQKGPNLIIHQSQEILANMNDWCKNQFGWKADGNHEPGKLAADVAASTVSEAEAERQVIEFVSKHVEAGKGLLSGNTVHADKRFLEATCPSLCSISIIAFWMFPPSRRSAQGGTHRISPERRRRPTSTELWMILKPVSRNLSSISHPYSSREICVRSYGFSHIFHLITTVTYTNATRNLFPNRWKILECLPGT